MMISRRVVWVVYQRREIKWNKQRIIKFTLILRGTRIMWGGKFRDLEEF